MHTVERGLEVPSFGFIGISSHHLMHQLELQEQRRTRPVKAHIIANSRLAFFYQRWEHRCCSQGRALPHNQVFGQAVTVRKLGELAPIHKGGYPASVSWESETNGKAQYILTASRYTGLSRGEMPRKGSSMPYSLIHLCSMSSCMRVNTFSTCELRLRIVFGNAGQNNRRTVGEFSDKRQVSAHGLDGLPESGKQEIAPLFKTRNTVLSDTEGLGHADLS